MNKLITLDVPNVKDIIAKGLQKKIADLGTLRVGFDISLEYPSRETFKNTSGGPGGPKRRIVVKRLKNDVRQYAIGNEVAGEFDFETNEQHLTLGWVDNSIIEVSVWSSDSEDRDNIAELMKLWVLELEQDIRTGKVEVDATPFLMDNNVFAVKFLGLHEDVNRNHIIPSGNMYIASLTWEVLTPFFHAAQSEAWEKYKLELIQRIVNCVEIDLDPDD